MSIYKGFVLSLDRGHWIVTAEGHNVMPDGRRFDTEGEARIFADMYIASGGSPFRSTCDVIAFKQRVWQLESLRRED